MTSTLNIRITIDWELLKEQKRVLLWMQSKLPEWSVDYDYINGFINLIDHIQDEGEAQGCPVEWLTEEGEIHE